MIQNKSKENMAERPPIVVVLGHVDHGKSTLLDYIRKTNTTDKEAGGITQHISAYEVVHKTSDGKEKRITFLDTPGHKAFSKMRERGANLADVAVLVVSGEDGVKEQTIEVLKTIRETKMPFVVAINKIDKPNVDVAKIKQDLAKHEVFVEGFGGTVPSVPVSAKTGVGIPELLDMILLIAELEELKGTKDAPAEGVVVESHVNPQQGITATIIIINGTLKKKTYVGTVNAYAPVRKIDAFLNHNANEATFSSPVIVAGFNEMPQVGSTLRSFKTKKEAEQYIKNCTENQLKTSPNAPQHSTDGSEDRLQNDFFVPIVIKADATGSLEALEHEILKIEKSGLKPKIIHSGVGTIEEGDLKAAASSKNTIVTGLHVTVGKTAERVSLQQGITVKTFNVIYKLTEWLAEEIKKRTPKVMVEERTGSAKILKLFNTVKGKQVVGGKVLEGEIVAREKVKILRREKEIDRGEILELQQQKKRVASVAAPLEFGALLGSKYGVAPGDIIETFTLVEKNL